MNDILALLFGTAPVMLALVWRNAIDRRRDDADTVTATARAAIAKALGGESLVAVRTDPPTPWSHGRVHLTEPATQMAGRAADLQRWSAYNQGQVERLQHRLAEATGQPFEHIEADMQRGRYLDAPEALAYGLVDGIATRSCVVPISLIGDRPIITIEGIGTDAVGHAVQEAWIEKDVVQCGYCQSGQIMSAVALLKATAKPTDTNIEESMGGNLCRCATYVRIREAIKSAAGQI